MKSGNAGTVSRIGDGEARPAIRFAKSGDATNLYSVMVEAFGETYLPFSVFQAPASVNYIGELISRGFDDTGQAFVVADSERCIVGFYNATRLGAEFFLNYIATSRHWVGRGLGRVLAEAFEAQGPRVQCDTLGLDVFRSNEIAREWYARRGYALQRSSFHVLVALGEVSRTSGPPLRYARTEWDQAEAEEQAQGFSKLKCGCGPGSIELGLINGCVCKLLAWSGIALAGAVRAVATEVGGRRPTLIVSGLPSLPDDLPVKRWEESLRLTKPV